MRLDASGKHCHREDLLKNGKCVRVERSKLRVTVAIFVNALGEKELKPIVIWKSVTPRCLEGVDKSQLPVLYYHQPKAWMTSTIMHSVLTKLNTKMRSQGRFVLLLIDGAGCHPSDLEPGKYSNIKITFFPSNTTSVLQPLDLGTLKCIIVSYFYAMCWQRLKSTLQPMR